MDAKNTSITSLCKTTGTTSTHQLLSVLRPMAMDELRKTAEFSGGQIKLLLKDLNKNSSHTIRLKALKRFQDYISTFKPELYDDDVDMLFVGSGDSYGLLYWCGAKSSKGTEGILKRVCGPAMALLTWLLSLGSNSDNIYYDRFMALPISEILKINFVAHILSDNFNNIIKSVQIKSTSSDDCYEIISLLVRNYKVLNSNEKSNRLDINILLENNTVCRQKYMQWLQQSAAQEITTAFQDTVIQQIQNSDVRPTTWQAVKFVP
eukprot:gene7200-14681_t